MMREGMENDEIIKRLQVQFPETKLINPEQPWYTFFVPFLPYILGALAIFLVLLAWRRGEQPDRIATADMGDYDASQEDAGTHQDRLAKLRDRVRDDH
jgi:cytochrome c-type biogenesis protein CcmH/NrfF